MKLPIKLAVCYFYSVLHINVCECNEFPSSEKTNKEFGSSVGGAIVQKRTDNNFTYQCGLHYDSNKNRLLLVDRRRATFMIYYPNNGNIYSCHIKEIGNEELAFGIAVSNREDTYIIAANQTIYELKLIKSDEYKKSCSYKLTPLVNITAKDFEIIAHGTIDETGNLILGTKIRPGKTIYVQTNLYRVNLKARSAKLIDQNYKFTAEIQFDKSNKNLYVQDTTANLIYQLTYDAQTGTVSNKNVIFNMTAQRDTYTGRMTGLALDEDNKFWIAFNEARMVLRFDPNTKMIEHVISVPVSVTNSITFGDANLDTLYLATANLDNVVDKVQEPQAGALYGIRGLPAAGFKPNMLLY